jgi:hypothetical protein
MAYIKDPTTGKYRKTDDAIAPSAPSAPIKTLPADTSGAVRYSKNAQGGYTKTTVDPTSPDYSVNAKPNITTVAGLQNYAAQNGVTPPDQPKESFLQGLLHLLNTGAYAVGGLISGKGVVQGVKDHTLPSEALGIKNKVGGFIADILLDPTTYITFGYGAEAQLATKAGEVALSKAGTTLLKDSILKLGEEAGRKAIAEKVLEEGGEKFLAKDGLKFMGKQILPRSVVTAPFKAADAIAEKIPVLGKAYQGVKDFGSKAFVPFSDIKALPGGVGNQYVDKFLQFTKDTRGEVGKAVDEATHMGKIAKGELGSKAGTEISKILEGVATPAANVMKAGVDTAEKSSPIKEIVDYIQGQHKGFAEAEKSRGLLDETLPDYVRHYITPEGRELMQKRASEVITDLNSPTRVRNPFAKTRELDGSIPSINAFFKQKYGINKFFEDDAFKAFAARKAESIKATNTYDFLTNVGKEFGRPAEIVGTQIKNPITGAVYMKESAKPIYENGIKYVETAVPQLKGTLLPEQIVKHVDDTYKILTNEEATKKFLKLYDKVLGFWKGSVTGLFPSFHTRNFVGGTFNNYIAGVTNPARYLEADKIARGVEGALTTKLGTKYTYTEIRNMAEKAGVFGQPGYLDVMREVEKDINKGPVQKLLDTPKHAMEFVENRLRMPLFIDRIIKGDSAKEAANQVIKFHFDYAPETLAPFEQNVMKRLMPFYRWTRGNIPLQLEQMVKQPGKYAGLGKLVDNLQVDKEKAKEEFPILPPYMREGLPIRLGEKGGFSQYLYGLGLPVEDVNRLWKGSPQRTLASAVGELSPILKYPIEVATGQNLFTGEPIDANNRVYPFVNKVPGLREWLGVTEKKGKDGSVSYIADPYKLHFINTALGRFYTTAGKLSDDKTSGAVKFLYGVMGAKAKSVDIENEKYWRDRESQDNIEKALEDRGLLKQYQRAYVPK